MIQSNPSPGVVGGDPRSSHKASQPRAVCIFSQVVPAVDTWCVCLGWRVRGRFAGIRWCRQLSGIPGPRPRAQEVNPVVWESNIPVIKESGDWRKQKLKGTYHKRCKSPPFGWRPSFHLVQNQFVHVCFLDIGERGAFPLKGLTMSYIPYHTFGIQKFSLPKFHSNLL